MNYNKFVIARNEATSSLYVADMHDGDA